MIGTILGRLGRDAEIATTSGGTQYVKFTLAENVYRNGKDETIWYDVISYDPFVAKSQTKVLKKGSFAIVVGDVDCRVNVGKNGGVYLNTHITATSIKVPYLGNGNDKKTSETTEEPTLQSPSIDMNLTNNKTVKPKMEVKMEVPSIEIDDDNPDDDLPF